jgi:ABC-type polysaccharide/polyol phosphate transport system ATPase subunit
VPDHVFEVRDVTKSFEIPSAKRETLREHLFGIFQPRGFEALKVLDGISFDVERGEALGIMGRNGSGKSTLLKILAGIYKPDSGSVTLRGPLTPILELGVGWNPELTARDNILLTGTAMGLTIDEIEASMGEILKFAELERFVNQELKFFSSGMSSRLAFSVAFRAVREVLLLDEIFAVGDAAFHDRCEERYQQLHKAGHTIVLVSHAPETIAKNCNRALLIEGGRVIMNDDAKKVSKEYLRLLGAS